LSETKDIGLFCGTFNPIHNAHLLLAQCACDQFKLAKIYFVTSPRPPHRQDVFLSGEERHKMVSQAVTANEKFVASSVELERAGPSYTIDTIKYFKDRFAINLIVGIDNIIHLPTWHKSEEIFQSCKLLIAPRRLANNSEHHERGMFTAEEFAIVSKIKYDVIDFPLIDISSSDIRQRIKIGKSIHYMVPESAWQLIVQNGYYK